MLGAGVEWDGSSAPSPRMKMLEYTVAVVILNAPVRQPIAPENGAGAHDP